MAKIRKKPKPLTPERESEPLKATLAEHAKLAQEPT
jgi:hypothetical protein